MKILKAFYVESKAVNAFRGGFWYLITDRTPRHRYSERVILDDEKASYERGRRQVLYYSTVKPFVNSYVQSSGTKGAFGGGTVRIAMKDGRVEEFKGDLWDAGQHLVNQNLFSLGVSTRTRLKKCYVFNSQYIDKDYFGKWLDENPDKIEQYERGKL